MYGFRKRVQIYFTPKNHGTLQKAWRFFWGHYPAVFFQVGNHPSIGTESLGMGIRKFKNTLRLWHTNTSWGEPCFVTPKNHSKRKHQKKLVSALVVSTHLKNISRNGDLPQIGLKITNIWNQQPQETSVSVFDLNMSRVCHPQVLASWETIFPKVMLDS